VTLLKKVLTIFEAIFEEKTIFRKKIEKIVAVVTTLITFGRQCLDKYEAVKG